MKYLNRLVLAVLIFSIHGFASPSTISAQSKPLNVLFIAIDDLNDWVGGYGGHPQVQTPHMDGLAARGTAFMNAHCQAPICNPGRVSMISGLLPSKTGVYFLQPGLRGGSENSDAGWVEAGDNGKIAVSDPQLLKDNMPSEMPGVDPSKHIREFLDCVKSRGRTACNESVTRRSENACHAAAISWKLGKKLQFDPATERFVNAPEANAFRSYTRREGYTI